VTSLPIDSLLPNILEALQQREALVLEAPPGAGKTTRVPRALLETQKNEVLVLQPRRLATRLAAQRVADEMGVRMGELVGYQVRFDDVSSAKTRLRFLTEGLLVRRLVSDPALRGVGCVVLDEFHERHLATDLSLAMVRRLQQTSRPDLKLVVMSATLDAGPIASWLGDAPRLTSEGRRFEIAFEHLEREDERPLEQQVTGALKRLVQGQLDGHVLVFLPGAAEIRRAHEAAKEFCDRQGLEIHVLHGELSAAEQDRALAPSSKRKVILSTNVAETSVTIDGVAAVIDSGLARVATHSPFSGLPQLKVAKVSKSSAIQRAGRAGRTRAGVAIRLYSKGDYEGRPLNDVPEIRRLDVTEALLSLKALGVKRLTEFNFFEPPAASALEAGEALLKRLGALDAAGAMTDIGKRLATLPVHPRLGRVLVECDALGFGTAGAWVAALLAERDIRAERRMRMGDKRAHDVVTGPSDVLELLDRSQHAVEMGLRAANVDAQSFASVERVAKSLKRVVKTPGSVSSSEARDTAVQQAVLAGFADRVARRRRAKSPEVVFAEGGSATLESESVVQAAELMVCVDAEEKRGGVSVRLASAIDPDWLLERFFDDIVDESGVEWNAAGQRVERVSRLRFGAVALEEKRLPADISEATAALLAEHATAAGGAAFAEAEALTTLLCRIESLRQGLPESAFPAGDAALVKQVLTQLCASARSFADLREAGLLGAIEATLTPTQQRQLHTHAPDRITLPSGRQVRINYEPAKPPWIESRLQDFFGLLKGPSIGHAPLVLHLLAPNMRAVQVTTDLSGFWDRHYPAIRKELMRHYPRHSWPEDPRTAKPPEPRGRR
jgi:ATP-dependent helicase HrpB